MSDKQEALAELDHIVEQAWAKFDRIREPARLEFERIIKGSVEYNRYSQWAEANHIWQTALIELISSVRTALAEYKKNTEG